MKSLYSTDYRIWFFLLLVVILMNSCAFSPKVCNGLLEKAGKTTYDIIIVPGVPFEDGRWSFTMKERVCWSKYLYDRGIAKNVMYSGAAVYSPYREGEIMALYAEKIGIKKENIYSETKAEHSTENIYYGYKKAKMLGFHKIALASDAFQTKMLRRFARKIIDPGIGLIPVVADTVLAVESKIADPQIDYQKAYVKDFVSIMDREGFFKRWRGTRGLDIDTTAY